MTSEQKKSFVTETWGAFGKGDIKTAFGNMADNVSWLIPGNISGVPGVKRGANNGDAGLALGIRLVRRHAHTSTTIARSRMDVTLVWL